MDGVKVQFVENEAGIPKGKLADAELQFTDGPLAGLKLLGFAIWERRSGGRTVTYPARQYRVNGESRSFALLRPYAEPGADAALSTFILNQFAESEYEQHVKEKTS